MIDVRESESGCKTLKSVSVEEMDQCFSSINLEFA